MNKYIPFDIDKILDKLPTSYTDMKFSDYLKVSSVKIDEGDNTDWEYTGIENSYRILSTLTGIDANYIKELPMRYTKEMIDKVSFLFDEYKPIPNTSLQFKDIDEISIGGFIICSRFFDITKSDFNHLPDVITAISKTDIKREQVLDLPTSDVLNGFFLLRTITKKSLKCSRVYLTKRTISLAMKQIRKSLTINKNKQQ